MTRIVVNVRLEATHNWPGCDIPEVAFLRHPHMHTFHIRCAKPVSHDDRDIEIIVFARQVTDYLRTKYGRDLGATSCEMLARELLDQFALASCVVLEDGVHGAEVVR